MAHPYHVRQTRAQDQKVYWERGRSGMKLRICDTISLGSCSSRVGGFDSCGKGEGFGKDSMTLDLFCCWGGILNGCDISTFQLLCRSRAITADFRL